MSDDGSVSGTFRGTFTPDSGGGGGGGGIGGDDSFGCVVFVVLFLIVVACSALADNWSNITGSLSSWRDYAWPQASVMAWYYYAVYLPGRLVCSGFGHAWDFFCDPPLTPFVNINHIFGILAVALYGVVIVGLPWLIFRTCSRTHPVVTRRIVLSYLVGPFVLWAGGGILVSLVALLIRLLCNLWSWITAAT